MIKDATASQLMLGVNVEVHTGRTIDISGDKGPVVVWSACLIPVGCFDKHGEKGYVVDVVTALDPSIIRSGVILMSSDMVGTRFMTWCAQNGFPQPDGKHVRKIVNGLVADPQSETPTTYVDGVGEVEHGVWALSNGVMVEGEFIPMERGHHRQTSKGRRIVYAPSITCDEICGSGPLEAGDLGLIAEWASDFIYLFGSMAPIITASWIRASVLRSRVEEMDAQLPAIYICGDSHRGKTLMATVALRMLGSKGERPHANMTSSSNAGVFLAASARSSLPFVMDEVKPYTGMGDNDLVKSLVNGDIPAKSTRSGRLRSSVRIKSMPMLVSEFVPGDMSSITNRVFTANLVSLGAHAKTGDIHKWVWWADKYQPLYDHWSYAIYHDASVMEDAAFKDMWKVASEDAIVICDDACMTLNRSVTATAIAIMGFKLLDGDSGGLLEPMYRDFCEALSVCLRDMSRLVTDVSAIGRYITSLRSGWSSMEGRYSKLVCDRVFTFGESRGLIVDHITLHGVLMDSHRIDPSRLGNPATVAMVLESEGFKAIKDDRYLRGRYSMPIATFLKRDWAYDMSRLITIMDCTCAKLIANAVESRE